MGPQSRNEQYLAKIAGENADLPEFPQSRTEQYLAKIAGEDVEVPEHPQSRAEEYLAVIAEGGGGGGDIDVESLSATENKTYTAPTGKAYSPVVVNVPNSYAAGDEGKVVSNGALVAQTSDTVTQNGTVDTTLINSLLVNVSGGGASNVVMGTFKATANGAMDVSLPYDGNGYPIALLFWPEEGANNTGGDFYNEVRRYATDILVLVKNYPESVPTYTGAGDENRAYRLLAYKNNSSGDTTFSSSGQPNTYSFNNTVATQGTDAQVMIKDRKTLSVFFASLGQYAFSKGIEYRYAVIYSS